MGAYVVSSDEIVHKLLSPSTDIGKKVIDFLGRDIVVDQQIDRSQIARKVFQHADLLKGLEEIIHSAVQKEIDKHYLDAKKNKQVKLFLAEVPLLFETGSERYYDAVIVVVAKESVSKERFFSRTQCMNDEYERRSARQLQVSDKQAKADYVIMNQGNFEELKVKVKELFNQLTQ